MRTHILLAALAILFASGARAEEDFQHAVRTEAKPWSHEAFQNDPQEFQFAILTDRTGGMRPGVFASAVTKMNLVRPEFVISVGDYIQGYTTDGAVLRAQWEEMDGLISGFEMPFFALPGNHDITNTKMQRLYEARFGTRYYAFAYKDVLFVCLDTQDAPIMRGEDVIEDAGLLPGQIAWAREVLEDHRDVRWTFVLMHQPLWLYEEMSAPSDSRHAITGRTTGWAEIEKALGGRDYTVLAGHLHRYTKYVRSDRNYIVLATTGGGSELRGPAYGEFDHAVWVTMTRDGPRIANLLLDGIRDDDIYTDRTTEFRESLRVAYAVDEAGERVAGTVTVHNPFRHPLSIARAWTVTNGPGWRLHSSFDRDLLQPGEDRVHTVAFEAEAEADLSQLPDLELACAAGSELFGTYPLESPLRPYLGARRPRLTIRRLADAPVIDGSVGVMEWAGAGVIPRFMKLEVPAPSEDAATVWCGYDADHFYVAGRFTQDPDRLRLDYARPDQPLWEDDSIELFFDANLDERTHAKVIITADNVLALENVDAVESAVGRTDDAWTFEARISWTQLGLPQPKAGDRFGFNPRRNRSLEEDRLVSEWTPTLISYPFALDLYGIVEVE